MEASAQYLPGIGLSFGAFILVLGTTAISLIGHLAYAVAFSSNPMVAADRRARRRIVVGLGTFFCFASYKLITSKT